MSMFSNYGSYGELVKALKNDTELQNNPELQQELLRQAAEQQYGSSSFDQEQFNTLLNKLTGSKMKQQRQKSVEGRRDIFAGGLAGMMSNF